MIMKLKYHDFVFTFIRIMCLTSKLSSIEVLCILAVKIFIKVIKS